MSPSEQYSERLEHWRAAHARALARHRQLGNLRLATAVVAVAIAGLAFGAEMISGWWILLPVAVLIVLVIAHERVDRERDAAARGIAYFELAMARLTNRWVGKGNQGERFRNSKHVYADDLDLFGRGSLFELLSTARTAAGENTLAHWLLTPGERDAVLARQQAVEELRGRIDLREELALMGEDIRAAVDARSLEQWGERPAVVFLPGARIIAAGLAGAAVVTIGLFFAHVFSALPFLFVLLAELIFYFVIRDSVTAVTSAVSTPARDLLLLSLLLGRFEEEAFQSPRLVELKRALATDGRTSAQQIQRLERLVGHLISANNQFFALVAAVLLWVPQFAMAIEAWRQRCGPRIGKWTAAIGEFEALCSFASFAYERPQASFPELLAEGPLVEAEALQHPLLAPEEAVPNDVSIGGPTRLWIVSGSNMSGKSTLMRSIGLNAVLAWAGGPVTCARMRISPLYIGASMNTHDSLIDHRSRFYAEIERLSAIVNLARAGHPTLFLLDELLSGTNSHDRRIGAEALIRGLVERGAIGIVTTHDLALAQIADTFGGRAINVHFEDHIEGGEIRFDYHLRPGVVTRSNALELMRAVGLDV